MRISVIMTVYNRPRYLRAALESLRLQNHPDIDIVIADDGSDPAELAATEQIVAECRLPARLLRRHREGFRLAAARNEAIRASTGEYLLFIDCDILLLPGALAVHGREAAPGRFLVGNRGMLGQEDTERLFAGDLTPERLEEAWPRADDVELTAAARAFTRNAWRRRFGIAKRHKPKLLGCHFSMHRATIERVNGFDEQYVGWGLEDDDLALRLYAAGLQSRSVIHEARALHLWHVSGQPGDGRGFASPNRAYFERRTVTPRCRAGLLRE